MGKFKSGAVYVYINECNVVYMHILFHNVLRIPNPKRNSERTFLMSAHSS